MKTPRVPKAVVVAERHWAEAIVRSLDSHGLVVQTIRITAVYLTEKRHEATHRRRAKAVFDAWSRHLAAPEACPPHTPEPSQ